MLIVGCLVVGQRGIFDETLVITELGNKCEQLLPGEWLLKGTEKLADFTGAVII